MGDVDEELKFGFILGLFLHVASNLAEHFFAPTYLSENEHAEADGQCYVEQEGPPTQVPGRQDDKRVGEERRLGLVDDCLAREEMPSGR